MRDPVTESMVASGVLDGLVLVVFAFRIWIRIKLQRVGWEDIWATIAFVCGALNAACDWVQLVGLRVGGGSPATTAMWIYSFTFTCLIWAVRVSILFSVIRIIPAYDRFHAYGLWIIGFFVISCLALLVEKAVLCDYSYHAFKSTPSNPYSRCKHFNNMNISEVAVGSVADVITVAFPLYILRNVTLPPRHLRLLRLLFSTTIMVSITCSIGLVFHVVPGLSLWSMFITNFQTATCLIVCNLLVVVTYLYRVLEVKKHGQGSDETSITDDEEDGASASSSVPRQMTLTTIDLLFSTPSGHVSLATMESGTASR